MKAAGAILLAYGLGSCLFAAVVGRIVGRDLRREGSGNLGASNVQRVLGLGPGLVVFVLDGAKGAAAAAGALALGLGDVAASACAFAAVLGHCAPFWNPRAGGKGASTGAFATCVLAPLAGAVALCSALMLRVTTKKASLGTLGGAGAALLAAGVGVGVGALSASRFGGLAAIAVLIAWRHRGNIARLRRGEELGATGGSSDGSAEGRAKGTDG
ncbi:MAG: glycerol-3-phosphate acyltransferase [Myxococcota bacterium]